MIAVRLKHYSVAVERTYDYRQAEIVVAASSIREAKKIARLHAETQPDQVFGTSKFKIRAIPDVVSADDEEVGSVRLIVVNKEGRL